MYDLTILPHFWEPSKKGNFISTFSEFTNKYKQRDESSKELKNSRIGENSLRIGENVVSHFPNSIYNGFEDLAGTITNPANCHSSTVKVSVKDNSDFTSPELVFYTDISKPNLVGILTVDF